MYCAKCGNELIDGAKFCSKCGTVTPQFDSNDGQVTTDGFRTPDVDDNYVSTRVSNRSDSKAAKIGVPIIIIAIVVSTCAATLSVSMIQQRYGQLISYRTNVFITVGIMIGLVISCLLLRVASKISIIPIVLLTAFDFITIQATMAALEKVYFNSNVNVILFRIIIPITTVCFIIAVISGGATRKIFSVLSILLFVGSSVAIFYNHLYEIHGNAIMFEFRGLASYQMPMIVRSLFYLCYAIISFGILISKDKVKTTN